MTRDDITPPYLRSLSGKRTILLLGSGGVGKTTCSIALSIGLARAGKKVALLSIDPAKRLADALGIHLGANLTRIKLALKIEGEVWGAMLDQKIVFDQMVHKYSPSEVVEQRILQHPMYIAASTNLSGPLEYMALAKLNDIVLQNEYDVVVLDTPPDTQALDFLARPNVLAGFMDHKVMNLLLKPFLVAGRLGLNRVLTLSEKLMGGVSQITGLSSLKSFAEFLVLMQEIILGFHHAAQNIESILKSQSTGFVLVCVPTNMAKRAAINLLEQLGALQYQAETVIVNRCLQESAQGARKDGLLERRLKGESKVLVEMATLFNEKGARHMGLIPERTEDIHNLQGLLRLSDDLRKITPI